MNSTGSEASAALKEDVNILQRELLTLGEKREALLKQIEQEENELAGDGISLKPAPEDKVDKDEKRMQDILVAYRLTGVTFFSTNEADEKDWAGYTTEDFPAAPKEVGIRFETFAQGRYHEPYYVMLRRKEAQQDIDVHGNEIFTDKLFVSKHTIPHWIALRDIEKRYLNRDMSTFTRIVSEHLQEYVERRESSKAVTQEEGGTTVAVEDTMQP